MLKLMDSSGKSIPLTQYENLVIESDLENDDKTLSFSMPTDIVPTELMHENFIRTQNDEFVIKEINADGDQVSVKATLNIDALEGTFFENFNTCEQTIKQAMQLALSGTNWTVKTALTKKRTLKLTNVYVWDIIKQIIKTYRVEIQIDSINKTIEFVEQRGEDKGTYFTSQLNLKSVSKKSDTNEFYTRIKPVGKDGLTIADVNGGKNYLENYQYTNKVKTYYWKDERYTDPESLMEDAAAKLNDLSKPYCSYSCEIADLAANSDKFHILEYSIGDFVWLLDEKSKIKEKQRIVKITEYPDSPENNSCELANVVLTFEEYTSKYDDTSDKVDNIMVDNGTVDGDCIDEIDSSKIVNLDIVVANEVTVQTMNITMQLNAVSGKIGELETNKLSVTDAQITYATIENLNGLSGRFENFYVSEFKALSIETDSLKSNVGDIKTLIFGSASGSVIQTEFANAVIAQLGDAQIESAMIKELAADKITGLDINTTKLTVHSDDGKSIWKDNTIQISDANRVRVQIGKDASNDYNLYIWDKAGNLMFDALGLTSDGIQREIIRNDMVSADANISASKLDISSLFKEINGSTETIKSSKIYIDADGQTLDVSFKNMTTSVNTALSTANTANSTANTAKNTADTAKNTADGALEKANTNEEQISTLTKTVSTQGTQISAIQGQISSKIWKQDITTAVSAIEIGGRNLLKNSATHKFCGSGVGGALFSNSIVSDSDALSGKHAEITCTAAGTGCNSWVYPDVINGKTYTWSFWGKCSAAKNRVVGHERGGTTTISLTTEWKFFTHTFVAKEHIYSSFVWYENWDVGEIVYIRDFKFEEGSKATTWTPAPEDTETSINTLSDKYTDIKQTVDGISTTVASHTTQIANKADGSTVTTVSNKVASLEQNLNGFKTTVSEDYTTKAEFNNLQIGGRNLLIDSANHKFGSGSVNGTFSNSIVSDDEALSGKHSEIKCMTAGTGCNSWVYPDVINGKTYTWSFWGKCSAVKSRVVGHERGGITTISLTTEWKFFTHTFVAKEHIYSSFVWYENWDVGEIVYIRDFKFEEGSKATTWTPAPEDTETSINTLSDKYTDIKQTVDGISTTVASHTTQIANKADGSTVTTVANKVASLEQNLNGFKTTVSEDYTTKTEFNNLQIGGRNLIRNSNFSNKTSNWTADKVYMYTEEDPTYKYMLVFKGASSSTPRIYNSVTNVWKAGETYTVSYYAKSTENNVTIQPSRSVADWGEKATLTTSWKKYVTTIKSTVTAADGTLSFTIRNLTATFYITNVKLEVGNKATDWTPAPEDVENSIDSVSTQYTQLSDKFNWVVKSGTSASDFTITDRMATLTANYINLNGLVSFSGLNNDTQSKINTASSNASTALSTANTANSTANAANNTANIANSTANTAKSTADTANTNANTALSTANTAKTNASTALNRSTYQYGTCSTAAATAAKAVTLSGFSLYTGAMVSVFFTYANTAASPTLNVNGTGAKSIRVNNTAITAAYYWAANNTVTFVYNGTYWVMSDTSANSIIAGWCYNNNKTYINGGKIYTGTITANQIAAGAVTADKIKVTDLSSLNATIGGWNIDNNSLYADYDNGAGTLFRSYIQKATVHTDWVFSTQISQNGGESFYGRTYIRADGFTKIYELDCAGTATLEKGLTVRNSGIEIYHNTTPYIDFHYGNATSDHTNRLLCNSSGQLEVSAGFKVDGQLLVQQGVRCNTGFNVASSDTYHMGIYDGGNMLSVKTDLGNLGLQTNGAVHCVNYANTASVPIYASAFTQRSSRRYKKHLGFMQEKEADKLLALEVVKFDYINGEKDQYGLYAEETEHIIPECVIKNENNQPDGIDYTKLIPFLIKKVQMQEAAIKRMDNLITHLIGIAI